MTSAGDGTFGDAAAEMPHETEVEVPLPDQSAADQSVAETEEELRVSDFIEEGAPLEPADVAAIEGALQERTADLQRLQAEFLNYKRRVDRDRDLIRENATYAALAPITEVLDNIDRAKEHGPLDDGFKAVAEQLERTVASLGLIKFGTAGDAFDPNVHEALSHIGQDPEVTVTTCKVIAKSGYKIGDRVVRAAQVLVVDPADQ
ncbi:nucleotide exchange factor GrpE [Nocardioides sp.]|uniref:nucleotide exchange factor GrpE n=1 Tax=Nocardioides sp. TaxID=35761 RepID=UPI00286B7B9D|nr:nucleotide exchange factor GrpE [Nocardioides sp.]